MIRNWLWRREYAIFFDTRLVEQGKSDSLSFVLSRLRHHKQRADGLTCSYIRFVYHCFCDEIFFRSKETYESWSKRTNVWISQIEFFDDINKFCTEILTSEMQKLRQRKANENSYSKENNQGLS